MSRNGAAILSDESKKLADEFGRAIGLEREDRVKVFQKSITGLSSTAENIYELEELAGDKDKLRTTLFSKMSQNLIDICQSDYRDMESMNMAKANAAQAMMEMHPEDAAPGRPSGKCMTTTHPTAPKCWASWKN